MTAKTNIVVGVSGGGRSLANLFAKQQDHSFQVSAVFASRPDCNAVSIAQEAGVEVFVGDFQSDAIKDELYTWLAQQNAELMVLAGFMKKLPIDKNWQERIINIHPSLLPEFGGKGMYGDRVHAAVLAAKAPVTGATVHYVNQVYDDGRVIAQIKVPVLPNDSTEDLATRVFAAECKLLPAAIDRVIAAPGAEEVLILE